MGCYMGSSGWSAREDSHWPLPARYPTAAPGHHAEAADAPVELAAFLLLPCSGLMRELTHTVSHALWPGPRCCRLAGHVCMGCLVLLPFPVLSQM